MEEGYISDRVGDLSEVQIIAVEEQVVIYIDGSLVASFENQPVSGEINVFCMEDFQTLILDDVQFWNLDGVELPSPGSSVQPDEGETSSQPDNEIPRPASLLGKVQLFETTITSLDWSLPEDNSVETWVVATSGNQMLILDKAYNQNLYDETAQILSVNFENPGGGRGLTLGCDDGSLKYYTNLGRYWSKLYELDGLEGRGAITSVQYGSSTSYHDGVEGGDGAAATDTGWLAVWNSLGDTGTLIFRKEIDEGPVYSMDWNVENRQLLTVSENQGLQVWNTATGGRLLKMDFQSRSASWSPDGRYIALEDHSESPMLVVLQSGAVKAQAELPAGANQVAWSPDGRLIATGGVDGIIRLWRGSDENMSIPSLELIREFQQDTEITAIAWSPDSQQLVTGDVAGYIWYWDVDK